MSAIANSAAAAAVVFTLAIAGCRDAGREEARFIARAYEDFEQAGAGDRPSALGALRGAQCSEPPTCDDRDACVAYATAIVRTRELADAARALGPEDAGGNGAATEVERARIISGAQEALEEAEKQEPRCHTALARLHQRAR